MAEDSVKSQPASKAPPRPGGPRWTAYLGDIGWASKLILAFAAGGVIVTLGIDWLCATRGGQRPFASHFVLGLAVAGMIAPLMLLQFRWHQVGVIAALAACLYVVYLIPWTSRKAFLQDLWCLREGMTVAEVESIMRGYPKGAGWEGPSGDSGIPGVMVGRDSQPGYSGQVGPDGTFTGTITFRHSDCPEYRGDFGVVAFRDGKVVSINYPPDLKSGPAGPAR